jgi:hypothetical protein
MVALQEDGVVLGLRDDRRHPVLVVDDLGGAIQTRNRNSGQSDEESDSHDP